MSTSTSASQIVLVTRIDSFLVFKQNLWITYLSPYGFEEKPSTCWLSEFKKDILYLFPTPPPAFFFEKKKAADHGSALNSLHLHCCC